MLDASLFGTRRKGKTLVNHDKKDEDDDVFGHQFELSQMLHRDATNIH